MNYWWKVHDDLCGRDHFPILIEILQPLHDEILPHWKQNKSNWEVFETLNEQKLFQDTKTTDKQNIFGNININNKRIYSKNLNLEYT